MGLTRISEKMKLVVHIGTEKTGTSSIQEFLYNNQERLSEKGYYFSQIAGQRNNVKIPLACMRISRDDPFFRNNKVNTEEERKVFSKSVADEFSEEIRHLKGIHTVIISSEHFHSLLVCQDEVEKFKETFCSHFDDVSIICYLREQVSVCVSHYSTVIKSGLSPELNEFVSRCTPENPYYNYLELLNRWSFVFGKKNVVVGIFDKYILKNKDIIDDFFNRSCPDLDLSDFVRTNEKNLSLNYIGQCILKEINKSEMKSSNYNNTVRYIQSKFTGKGENVSPEVYFNHFSLFKSTNRELNRLYFGKDQELFPYNAPRDSNIIPNAKETINQLVPLIEFILNNSIEDYFADVCRDSAIELEAVSLDTSYQLMKLANKIRPHGQFIASKLSEYEEILVNN